MQNEITTRETVTGHEHPKKEGLGRQSCSTQSGCQARKQPQFVSRAFKHMCVPHCGGKASDNDDERRQTNGNNTWLAFVACPNRPGRVTAAGLGATRAVTHIHCTNTPQADIVESNGVCMHVCTLRGLSTHKHHPLFLCGSCGVACCCREHARHKTEWARMYVGR